jgi:hypothetical protein
MLIPGSGAHSDFYNKACPNAYAFPDDDCSNYHHSPMATCGSNNRMTMTVCANGASSNYDFC